MFDYDHDHDHDNDHAQRQQWQLGRPQETHRIRKIRYEEWNSILILVSGRLRSWAYVQTESAR